MTTNESLVDSARAFIRQRYEEDGCVVSISDLLNHFDERFGAAARPTDDVPTVLGLCYELWEDPHIDQVHDGGIDFCWNEEGRRPQEGWLSRALRARLSRPTGT